MATVTKSYIERYLDTHSEQDNKRFIGRALVVLFNNQTEDEKRTSDTNELNGIGFTGADGQSGCITAKYFLKHKNLLDWQVDRWLKKNKKGTRRISKYWRQLDAAAQAKRARNVRPVNPDVIEARDAFREHPVIIAEREMKDMFAKHELQQEQRAFAAKEGIDLRIV